MISIHRNVMSGQCKNALVRIQVRHTAVFLLAGCLPGWAGSQVGLFTPRKTDYGYSCTGFYFSPWLAPDKAVAQLPQWYIKTMNALSFRIGER